MREVGESDSSLAGLAPLDSDWWLLKRLAAAVCKFKGEDRQCAASN